MSAKSNNVCLVDMDGTLADYIGQLQRDLEPMRAPGEPEWKVSHDEPPHIEARASAIKRIPGWWLNLPRLERGFEVYSAAAEMGFTMEILTKGPRRASNAWSEKLMWCQRELGDRIDVHLTFNKARVYGKVLVDDYPPYMDAWLEHRPRGLGIMPLQDYNKDYRHPQVVIYDGTNLDEVRERLQAAFDRKVGEL